MGLRDLLKGLLMTNRRDPDVVKQVADAARDIKVSNRLIREISGLQGELERARPSKHHQGAAAWGSNKQSSS